MAGTSGLLCLGPKCAEALAFTIAIPEESVENPRPVAGRRKGKGEPIPGSDTWEVGIGRRDEPAAAQLERSPDSPGDSVADTGALAAARLDARTRDPDMPKDQRPRRKVYSSGVWNWLSQFCAAGSPVMMLPARSWLPPTISTPQLQSGRRIPNSEEIGSGGVLAGG